MQDNAYKANVVVAAIRRTYTYVYGWNYIFFCYLKQIDYAGSEGTLSYSVI